MAAFIVSFAALASAHPGDYTECREYVAAKSSINFKEIHTLQENEIFRTYDFLDSGSEFKVQLVPSKSQGNMMALRHVRRKKPHRPNNVYLYSIRVSTDKEYWYFLNDDSNCIGPNMPFKFDDVKQVKILILKSGVPHKRAFGQPLMEIGQRTENEAVAASSDV
ncbi:hypothetical protein CBS101457_005317 [Exobasidium rhododendri]|nr:hypothetical protein CBS101457_005317 [Exobasidium rhododendri]